MKYHINQLVLSILLLPLGSIGQTSPIAWSWKAVRVDSTHFQFLLTADIFRGWYLYKPNMGKICPFSPIITFSKSANSTLVDTVDVIEGTGFINTQEIASHPACNIPTYSNSVTFVQTFNSILMDRVIVRGKVVYYAMNPRIYEGPYSMEFEFEVNSELDSIVNGKYIPMTHVRNKNTEISCTAKICTHYPKGVCRKTWWWITHPFGRNYIYKHYIR